VDRDLLVRAYDRTAGTYDEQFRAVKGPAPAGRDLAFLLRRG
jgi:hypothetical protein